MKATLDNRNEICVLAGLELGLTDEKKETAFGKLYTKFASTYKTMTKQKLKEDCTFPETAATVR